MRTYSQLIQLPSFQERFKYLKLQGQVSKETFGAERYLNQAFYHSSEWRKIRDEVITRDLGCDLGCPDYDIFGVIIIHHMNPITLVDLEEHNDLVLDPEFLICTSDDTHKAIHYGIHNYTPRLPVTRKPFDTCPWRH